jgi:hypothetical protein
VAGFFINQWLLPGFTIRFDPLAHLDRLAFSQCFSLDPEIGLNTLAAFAVVLLASFGFYSRLKPLWKKPAASDCCISEN